MQQPLEVIPQAIFKDAEDALKVAKISLMMGKNTAFYTAILFSLRQYITADIPTAAVDGLNLYVNPDFFTKLTPNERLTLLAHEVLHVALDHMHRMGHRNRIVIDSEGNPTSLWNIAGDYVINGSLVKAKYALPRGGLHDLRYDGMTTNQVYDILDKKTDKELDSLAGACGAPRMNGSDIQFPDANDPNAVSEDDVTEVILRATTQAKAMGQEPGSLPAEIDIELQRTLNPPLPWHIILRNFLTEYAKDDYSFRRPNKRFLPRHYLPVAFSESIANLAIAVDESCSVSDHEFNTFITKIAEMKEAMNPKRITVVSFNTKISKVQELTEDEDPFRKLTFHGRGGTSIGPVHKWAAETKPTVMIVFTDGKFSKTEPVDKNIPLIWLINNNAGWTNDFGQVINYDITV